MLAMPNIEYWPEPAAWGSSKVPGEYGARHVSEQDFMCEACVAIPVIAPCRRPPAILAIPRGMH